MFYGAPMRTLVHRLVRPYFTSEGMVMENIAETNLPRRKDVGQGVFVTEGEDGVFIHFKTPCGRGAGFCVSDPVLTSLLGRETIQLWALSVLNG